MQNPMNQKYNRFNEQINAFSHIMSAVAGEKSIDKILIYGCGKGDEAVSMQEMTGAQVVGVDVITDFWPNASSKVLLVNYDGEHLPFDDDMFDLIYSYHVLEHVDNVDQSLKEIKRVLKPDGCVYAGTPNKARLFGYFGMKDKTLKQKMSSNLSDWNKRLIGKWENHYGAHAGFFPQELRGMMQDNFGHAMLVTKDYYHWKWPHRQGLLNAIQKSGLGRFLYPSVYVFAKV